MSVTGGWWFAAGDYNYDPTQWGGPGSGAPKIVPAGTAYCPHNPVPTHPGSGTPPESQKVDVPFFNLASQPCLTLSPPIISGR